ncbi:MAG: ATP-binding protein [Elusimicrobiota bacterium]|nr:MAG: ATP-binding protein [Elusimicrobiota bacterium]
MTATRRKEEGVPAPDFRLLFESTPELYLVLAPDFTIAAASDAYLVASMTRRKEIVGRDVFDVFPDNPDDPKADGVAKLRASLERVLKTRRPEAMADQKYDVRRPGSEGGRFEERWWRPLNIPVLGEDGNVAWILHRVEDVTALARLEQKGRDQGRELDLRTAELEGKVAELDAARAELAEKNAALAAAYRELETFSYSVAHDLRAPVRAIDGFSSIILERCAPKLDAEDAGLLRRMGAAARGMGELIEAILELSQIARIAVHPERVDLSVLVRGIAASLREAQPARDVELVVAPGVAAWADPRLIQVVLRNLLENAWKYTAGRPKARVEFGTTQADGETAYFVRDDGAGFDSAFGGRLFTPFSRLHGKTEFPGSGIGLAIVGRIVKRHGGRVWADGKVGAGAAFYFTLPKR